MLSELVVLTGSLFCLLQLLPIFFNKFIYHFEKFMKIPTTAELVAHLSATHFRLLSKVVDEMGVEAYVVGGYVRDLILGRPSKDIDVVVVGSGIAVAQNFAQALGRGAHCTVFKNFGTAQVKWKRPQLTRSRTLGEPNADTSSAIEEVDKGESFEIEFVGARRESYQRDSRKPIVEDGTLDDDQKRRDFTINALAICLNAKRYGELIDPFEGVYDLQDGLITTPLDPDVTFSDDPLRMMRCIRFATQLNFQIEDETFAALQRNAERLHIISAERIIEELNKIMLAPHPSRGWMDLYRSGLLQIIFPELVLLDVVEERNGRKHKNNFYHTLEVLENLVRKQQETEDAHREAGHQDAYFTKDRLLFLRWAALFHDIGKPKSKRWDNKIGWTFHNHNYIGMKMVRPIFRRLKLPLDDRMKYVEKLVDLHMRPINIADEEVTDSAVRRLLFDAGNDIDDLMLLCEADITSKNEQRKRSFHANYRMVRQKLIDLEEKDRIRNFQPPISGNEIMEMFGLSPCQQVGSLKSALKDAILDGHIPNEREAAWGFIVRRAQKMGLHLQNETPSNTET